MGPIYPLRRIVPRWFPRLHFSALGLFSSPRLTLEPNLVRVSRIVAEFRSAPYPIKVCEAVPLMWIPDANILNASKIFRGQPWDYVCERVSNILLIDNIMLFTLFTLTINIRFDTTKG